MKAIVVQRRLAPAFGSSKDRILPMIKDEDERRERQC